MTGRLIESVEDTPPVVRNTFDVYLDENRLVYVKEEGRDEDIDAMFLLHLYPVDAADLPAHRRRYGFDNLDFSFRKVPPAFAAPGAAPWSAPFQTTESSPSRPASSCMGRAAGGAGNSATNEGGAPSSS